MRAFSVIFVVMLAVVNASRAQLPNDGATGTLANVTNTITGTVTVGTNGSFTLLTVAENALLTNTVNGVIGGNTTAKSNEVRLVSPTARWQMGGSLFIGSNGALSRLMVSNGAFVNNNNGLLGNGAASSNNFVLVTGPGSLWNNRIDLTVGVSSRDNQMIVNNGARVVSRIGNIGQNSGSSNNLVMVTGSGSVWTNHLDVNVGVNERNNRLIIEAGGQVGSDNGRVGGGILSDGSEALVTGPGSLWSSRTDLAVGFNSGNSRLVVSNGAAVLVGNKGRLGVSSGSTGNVVVVTGAGSLWSNRFELYVGEGTSGNRMEVNSGGRVASSNAFVGFQGASNFALVDGVGSLWSNRADLYVGHSSSANQLMVANGGVAFTGSNGFVGGNIGSSSNTVIVTDPGSRWLVANDLFLGTNGAFNRLVVSNGGFAGARLCYVGFEDTATNNLAVVTGAGSVLSNYTINVGLRGDGNQLLMTSGGRVLSVGGIVGNNSNNDRNSVVVTGPGTVWSNAIDLYIGGFGNENRLTVTNGGVVVTGIGFVGLGGKSNEVIVTGAGSVWSNRLAMYVGESGVANRLMVTNSGTVFGSNVYVGFTQASTNNRVVVNGGTLRATNASGTSILDVRRGTNVLNAGLVDVDNLVLTNKGSIPAPFNFGNGSSNHLNTVGPATPYPSKTTVTGIAGSVTQVSVTLSNLTHDWPDDLDILLVSPSGQKVILMSDAGGGSPVMNLKLTFRDTGSPIPDGSIFSGVFRPTDYPVGETFTNPAPTGPYSTNLSSFNGFNPNGDWSLYIIDDTISAEGSLVGWGIEFFADTVFLDPGTFELNGGTLVTRGANINNLQPFIVGGPGGVPAVWDARPGVNNHNVADSVIVGNNSAFNQLLIKNGAVVSSDVGFIVGQNPVTSTNNLLQVTGGTLQAGLLDVRGGTNRIASGLVDVDQLVVTNTRGQMELNGGTLRPLNTMVANGRVFNVGDGTSVATLQLLGGTHTFANNLVVANNGSLIGSGTVGGTVTVSSGGRIVPGAPIGRISVLGSVIAQGIANLQIDKSGGVRTNDQVTASGALFYGGTLNVTDIGVDVLSVGDRFILFSAAPYLGGFTNISLPPLSPGLTWANNLLVDGSIEVVAASQSQPSFSSITQAGATLIFAGSNGAPNATYTVLAGTNVAQPLTSWVSIATSQFDSNGKFSVTNSIVPGIPHRFFRIRIP